MRFYDLHYNKHCNNNTLKLQTFKNPCFIGSTDSGNDYDNGYTFKDPAL